MVGVATNMTESDSTEAYRFRWERLAALVAQYTVNETLDVLAPESLVNVPDPQLAEAAGHLMMAAGAIHRAVVAADKDPI